MLNRQSIKLASVTLAIGIVIGSGGTVNYYQGAITKARHETTQQINDAVNTAAKISETLDKAQSGKDTGGK